MFDMISDIIRQATRIPESLQRRFESRKSLLPVPLVLALSLIFVYLAAGHFNPNDLVLDEANIQNGQCVAKLEQKSALDSRVHLPENEVAASDLLTHPCATSDLEADPVPAESWAYLWPRLKTRSPRG